MYRIVKPLNNNIAIIRFENGEQGIVMGKGIVFGKKKGDLLPEDQTSDVFLLRDKDAQYKFTELLKEVPLEFIKTTYEIINEAIMKYHYPVQEYLYVTLTDHLYWSYKNIKKGTYEPNKLPDFSEQYPDEIAIAKNAVAILRKKISPDYPDDEIIRIALHFINAKRQDKVAKKKVADEVPILTAVEQELNKVGINRTKENQNFYDRLIIHLSYFIENLEREVKEEKHFSKQLESHLQEDYPKAYEIGEHIYQVIQELSGKTLSDAEKVYLTLHVQRLL